MRIKLTTLVPEKYSFSVELEEGLGMEFFTCTLMISVEKGKLEQKENNDSLKSQGNSTGIIPFIAAIKGLTDVTKENSLGALERNTCKNKDLGCERCEIKTYRTVKKTKMSTSRNCFLPEVKNGTRHRHRAHHL